MGVDLVCVNHLALPNFKNVLAAHNYIHEPKIATRWTHLHKCRRVNIKKLAMNIFRVNEL